MTEVTTADPTTTTTSAPPPASSVATATTTPQTTQTTPAIAPTATTVAPIATGGAPDPAVDKPYWPGDWREKAAKRIAGDDEKKVKAEMERLARIDDPASVYAMYRQIENTWASKNFVKLPPKEGASEADIKEYHKALGVPEKPEDYLKDIKLENGAVIGEQDKPMVQAFAAEAHKAGVPPAGVNAAINWYFKTQEDQAAKLDEADESFRVEATRALKEEYGGAYKRMTNNIKTLFTTAPGGANVDDAKSLGYRILNGRTADGRLIGNDPDIVRWLVGLAVDRNPADAVVEDGGGDASVDSEIDKIEKIMRTNRAEYNAKYADRYKTLLNTREKIQARKRA